MAVTLPLFLRLMADYLVDYPLIYSLAGKCRDEAMPQNVVAPQNVPLRVGYRPLKVIVGLVFGDSGRTFSLRLASCHALRLTK
jgi:hypothetical protein